MQDKVRLGSRCLHADVRPCEQKICLCSCGRGCMCVCDSAASITFHHTTHASGRQHTCIACWGREGTYSHVDAYAAAHTRFTRACMEWRQRDNDVHFSTSSRWHQIKASKDCFQTTLCLKSVWNTEDYQTYQIQEVLRVAQ